MGGGDPNVAAPSIYETMESDLSVGGHKNAYRRLTSLCPSSHFVSGQTNKQKQSIST